MLRLPGNGIFSSVLHTSPSPILREEDPPTPWRNVDQSSRVCGSDPINNATYNATLRSMVNNFPSQSTDC
jgi:hypothetical protein